MQYLGGCNQGFYVQISRLFQKSWSIGEAENFRSINRNLGRFFILQRVKKSIIEDFFSFSLVATVEERERVKFPLAFA